MRYIVIPFVKIEYKFHLLPPLETNAVVVARSVTAECDQSCERYTAIREFGKKSVKKIANQLLIRVFAHIGAVAAKHDEKLVNVIDPHLLSVCAEVVAPKLLILEGVCLSGFYLGIHDIGMVGATACMMKHSGGRRDRATIRGANKLYAVLRDRLKLPGSADIIGIKAVPVCGFVLVRKITVDV